MYSVALFKYQWNLFSIVIFGHRQNKILESFKYIYFTTQFRSVDDLYRLFLFLPNSCFEVCLLSHVSIANKYWIFPYTWSSGDTIVHLKKANYTGFNFWGQQVIRYNKGAPDLEKIQDLFYTPGGMVATITPNSPKKYASYGFISVG